MIENETIRNLDISYTLYDDRTRLHIIFMYIELINLPILDFM